MFSEEFLELFGNEKEDIGNLFVAENKLEIDVVEIAKKLGLTIEHTYSDTHLSQDDTIYVDITKPKEIQRFQIVREIG